MSRIEILTKAGRGKFAGSSRGIRSAVTNFIRSVNWSALGAVTDFFRSGKFSGNWNALGAVTDFIRSENFGRNLTAFDAVTDFI